MTSGLKVRCRRQTAIVFVIVTPNLRVAEAIHEIKSSKYRQP
jgi:hypothetical protein